MAKKRKPQRGGVNDAPVCLATTVALLVALGIGTTLGGPAKPARPAKQPTLAATQPVQLYRQTGGFRAAVATVLANEGGLIARDGNTGSPAIYGINAKWHPEAFAKAKRLTAEAGEAAGRAYAAEFYRREFWDRHGIGSLPASVQPVVLDGVVNHRIDFARRLVQAARNGASATRLLVMRWEEYRRLAASKEYAAYLEGWENRLRATARAVDKG